MNTTVFYFIHLHTISYYQFVICFFFRHLKSPPSFLLNLSGRFRKSFSCLKSCLRASLICQSLAPRPAQELARLKEELLLRGGKFPRRELQPILFFPQP